MTSKKQTEELKKIGFSDFCADFALVEYYCGSTELKSSIDISSDEEVIYYCWSLEKLLSMLPKKIDEIYLQSINTDNEGCYEICYKLKDNIRLRSGYHKNLIDSIIEIFKILRYDCISCL